MALQINVRLHHHWMGNEFINECLCARKHFDLIEFGLINTIYRGRIRRTSWTFQSLHRFGPSNRFADSSDPTFVWLKHKQISSHTTLSLHSIPENTLFHVRPVSFAKVKICFEEYLSAKNIGRGKLTGLESQRNGWIRIMFWIFFGLTWKFTYFVFYHDQF